MGIDKEKNLSAAAELRRHAEEQLREKTAQLHPPRNEEEPQKLIHELEVYRIELEMQVVEIRQSRDEAEAALEKYADLYDFAPVGYFTFDHEGVIRSVNFTGASLLGVERSRLLGRRFELFVAVESRPFFSEFLGKVFTNPAKEACDVALLKEGDSPLFVRIEGVTAASGQECRIALFDITEHKRVEETLRKSEEQFRALADSIPNLAWWANGDGFITWYNRRWYEYTGTTPEQMEGWGWQSVHDQGELPKVLERWQASIATGEPFDMTFPLRGADGVFRPFLTRVIPLKDAAGRALQWFGTNTDVSELKRVEQALRENEEQLALALLSADMGVWRLDLREQNRHFDDQVCRCLGIDPVRFGGTAEEFYDVVHPDDLDGVKDALDRTIECGAPYEIEYRVVWPDGRIRHISTRGRLARDAAGQPQRVDGLVWDITERKQAEEKLRKSAAEIQAVNARLLDSRRAALNLMEDAVEARKEMERINEALEHEIAERKLVEEELKQAKEAAEAATRAKSQFLANMSHELRTPMTGVIGMLDVVLSENLEADQRECIEIARTSARSLVRLLNDILDVTKLEMGKFSLEEKPFSIRQCIQNTINILIPVVISKGIRLKFAVADNVPEMLVGDQTRLNQVLTNLAGNAVKFTEKGTGGVACHGRRWLHRRQAGRSPSPLPTPASAFRTTRRTSCSRSSARWTNPIPAVTAAPASGFP